MDGDITVAESVNSLPSPQYAALEATFKLDACHDMLVDSGDFQVLKNK